MTPTSTSNYDALVLQRSALPSSGVYTCSIQDFYISAGRPGVLMSDGITSLDKIITTSSVSSYFSISMPRTLGNTSGEDWGGGDFVEVCFFTSDSAFSQSSWTQQYTACFGYQAQNYLSVLRGAYLGTMGFEGVASKIYGGVYGPLLQLRLFWLRNSSAMPNSSNIIIQIGDQISSIVGNDYYQCGVGDYYGFGLSSLLSDLSYSGYDNGACVFNNSGTAVFLEYTRDVYTYDSFDYQVTATLSVCLIGAQTSCATLSPPYLVPTMSVQSALQIHSAHLLLSLVSLLLALAL